MRNIKEYKFESSEVAKYARKSTPSDSADKSIEDQMYICNQVCDDWNLPVTAADNYIEKIGHGGDEWWDDFGGTGIEGDNNTKETRRPVLTKIVRGIVAGEIKAVVVWRSDRLWRKTAICDILIDLFNKYGVVLFDKNGPLDLESPEGRTAARNVATASQHQRESAVLDSKRGLDALKAKGGLVTTPNCLGFRSAGVQTQKAISIPEEIFVVNRIYKLFDEGQNMNQITKILAEENILFPIDLQNKISRPRNNWNDGKFYFGTIKTILSDCRYQGKQKFYGKEWDCPTFLIDGETAVPKELFERVQQKIENAKRIPYRTRYRHPMGGLIKCGFCGEGLQRKKGNRGPEIPYWMPKRYWDNHIKCGHRIPYLLIEHVDNFIAECLVPDILNELKSRGEAIDEKATAHQISELENSLKEEKQKSKDLMSYFGKISAESFIELESALTNKIQSIQEEIKKLKLKVKSVECIGERLENWSELTDSDKRDIFRSLIKWVAVLPPKEQKMIQSKYQPGRKYLIKDTENQGRYIFYTNYGTFHTGIVWRTDKIGRYFEVKLRRANEEEQTKSFDDMPNYKNFKEGLRRFMASVSHDPLMSELSEHFIEQE